MRLLFLGDSAGTGFGTVTHDLGSALIALGVDVRFVSLNEQIEELDEPFKGRTASLGSPDGWLSGNWITAAREALASGAELPADQATEIRATVARIDGMFTGALFDDGWVPEAAIILGDVGSLKVSPVLSLIPEGFPAFHYVPIEGIGIPPAWAQLWKVLKPVAVCEFGADVIQVVTGSRPPVIYHGVDRSVFHPVSIAQPIVMRMGSELKVLRTKADCRKFLGWAQDEIILFRSDRHMPRKCFAAMYRSVAPILAKYENVRLITHCRVTDEGGDLRDEISKYHVSIGSRMNITGIGGRADRKLLAAMYNAADIYVSTSAEGFGLTIAEAIACGLPAIGLDYSSVPEVMGPAGIAVRSVLIDNIYSYFWATPIEKLYTEALEKLVTQKAERHVMGAKGPYHVQKFDWAMSAQQFIDLARSFIRQEVAA